LKKDREALDLATSLIDAYTATRAGLRKLGILRTERSLQADYAEWLVARLLRLRLADNPVEKGVDAWDAKGRSHQVKSRLVRDLRTSTSFDFRSDELTFHFLVAVFLTPDLELLAVVRVPRKAVLDLGFRNERRFSFRWNRKVAQDPRIERLL